MNSDNMKKDELGSAVDGHFEGIEQFEADRQVVLYPPI